MWFEGAGVALADARYLYADPRGSIMLVRDGAGTVNQINSYDEYGIPGANNVGDFRGQYTKLRHPLLISKRPDSRK